MNLAYVRFVKVKLDDPSQMFSGYKEAIEEWFTQWTLENNYQPMIIDKDGEENFIFALQSWQDEFVTQVKQHFSYLIPAQYRTDYPFEKDFVFGYTMADISVGEPFYLPTEVHWVKALWAERFKYEG